MYAAEYPNTFVRRFVTSLKTATYSSLLFIGLAAGLAAVPTSGFAAQPTACPMAVLGDPTGNVCTASDINIATAVVGQQGDPFCFPGDTVEVFLEADFTIRNQTRYDPGIWVALDGLPLDVSAADGGAQNCQVMPVQGDHNSISNPGAPPFEIGDFDGVGP